MWAVQIDPIHPALLAQVATCGRERAKPFQEVRIRDAASMDKGAVACPGEVAPLALALAAVVLVLTW